MTDTKTTTPDPSTLEANATALNLNVDMNSGLTSDETEKRLEQYGRNELESAPPVPAWKKSYCNSRMHLFICSLQQL